MVIIVVIIIGSIAAVSQPSTVKKPVATPTTVTSSMTITVTIQNSIGIDRVTVNNLNVAGGIYQASMINLPLTFNCNRGDYLKITVTTQPGFEWNGLWFDSTKTFNHNNPYTFAADGEICVDNAIVITPQCLIKDIPTPTPTPTPTSDWSVNP